MSPRPTEISDHLYDYIVNASVREHEVLRALRDETANHPHVNMQIAPDQGQFMGLLAKLTRAKSYLEVGTFTGYSSLAMALSMPDDAEIASLALAMTTRSTPPQTTSPVRAFPLHPPVLPLPAPHPAFPR